MTLSINTNVPAIIAQRSLSNATAALSLSIERMSTGYKINHASDNAAGYSIANTWVTQLNSLDVASNNAAMGADLLTTAEESYSLLSSHLQRVRDLTEQAANGTYGSQSLRAIQAEVLARIQEIDRISSNIEYNGIHLMDGTVDTEGIELQVGLYANTSSQINLAQSLFSDSSIYGLFNGLDLTGEGATYTFAQLMNKAGLTNIDDLKSTTPATREAALESFAAACVGMKYNAGKIEYQTGTDKGRPKDMLAYIDEAINVISEKATKIGAAQNRVASAINSIDVQSQNLTSSLSTLRDTDIASESSYFVQQQILQQSSATLLSTANQMPSIALNLI